MSTMRHTGLGHMAAVAVETLVRRDVRPTTSAPSALSQIWKHKNSVWFVVLMAFIAVVHAYNMFNFPYYENDEGTYMSQAWAILHEAQLAPYTYWYDHAPAGWILIAGWALLTGGFHTFGTTAASGRVFMLLLHVASAAFLYGIARTISRHVWVASLASMLFSFSAYSVYFDRRVLLDNIATFWILMSLYLLLRGRFTLTRVWVSALVCGIGVLSKENLLFLVPAFIVLIYWRAHASQRLFSIMGWVAILSCVGSMYVLMALIKGEMFPTGTLLGGSAPHVSLLGSLSYQASRGKDGGIFNPNSGFWWFAKMWIHDEPLLVLGGTICAGISVVLIKWHRALGVIGMCSLLLWVFLARGGEVLGFYLVPSIPFFALNVALVLGLGFDYVGQMVNQRREYRIGNSIATICASVVTLACILSLVIGYMTPDLRYGYSSAALKGSQVTTMQTSQFNLLLPWTNTQAIAQTQATQWIEQNVGPNQTVVVDDAYWVDLYPTHPLVQWYWKVDLDPAIRDGVFHNNWRNIDYILVNLQIPTDAQQGQLTLVQQALAHCTVVAHFDTGGWPVSICKVENGRQAARVLLIPAQSARARRPASSAIAWRQAI